MYCCVESRDASENLCIQGVCYLREVERARFSEIVRATGLEPKRAYSTLRASMKRGRVERVRERGLRN